MESTVTLYLLDAPDGALLQQWIFENKQVIRIGRSPENDVVIAHKYVSRDHVCLSHERGSWVVTVTSQQGILWGPRKVFNLTLGPNSARKFVFRLGPNGPYMRFEPVAEEVADLPTVYQNPENQPILFLDREKLSQEVREISEGDCFRKLQATIEKLRGPRVPGPAESS